jgi:hypothetical protein
MDENLNEKKATGEESYSADPVVGAGGPVKNNLADVKKKVNPVADDIEKNVKTPMGTNNAGLHEAIAALFGDTDLSEDFKAKTVTIFEAAVHEKVEEARTAIAEEFEAVLAEQTEAIVEDLTTKLDAYLDYVVENWMEENEVALETGFKVQVAESLFDGLKSLMSEHNIEVDEETVDVVAAMEEQVAESNAKYNDLFEEMLALREETEMLQKNAALVAFSEGMVATDAERLKVLAESVSHESVEEFVAKLETIKESYFSESVARAEDQSDLLEEEVEEVKRPVVTGAVAAYVASLDKFGKN